MVRVRKYVFLCILSGTNMKVGERGQVTIPKPIRQKLGLGPDTRVEFRMRGNVIELRKSEEDQRAAVRSLFGRKRFPAGTDELLALLRE